MEGKRRSVEVKEKDESCQKKLNQAGTHTGTFVLSLSTPLSWKTSWKLFHLWLSAKQHVGPVFSVLFWLWQIKSMKMAHTTKTKHSYIASWRLLVSFSLRFGSVESCGGGPIVQNKYRQKSSIWKLLMCAVTLWWYSLSNGFSFYLIIIIIIIINLWFVSWSDWAFHQRACRLNVMQM